MTHLPQNLHMATKNAEQGFKSVYGVDPKTWGPPAWLVLYGVAFYGSETNLRVVLSAAARTLPCKMCRMSFQVFMPRALGRFPLTTPWYRSQAIHYIQNLVNQKIGQHIYRVDHIPRVSPTEVAEAWKHFCMLAWENNRGRNTLNSLRLWNKVMESLHFI